MTCVAHSTHGCALHAGCDGVRGGRIPEAGAGAAAVPGRPGQRTYASRLSQARLIAADGWRSRARRRKRMFRGNGQRAACVVVVVVVPPSPSHNDRARPGRRRKKESQSFGLLRSRFMSIDCSALRTEVYRAVLRAAMAAPGFSSSSLFGCV
jgi:hypothetical protein